MKDDAQGPIRKACAAAGLEPGTRDLPAVRNWKSKECGPLAERRAFFSAVAALPLVDLQLRLDPASRPYVLGKSDGALRDSIPRRPTHPSRKRRFNSGVAPRLASSSTPPIIRISTRLPFPEERSPRTAAGRISR